MIDRATALFLAKVILFSILVGAATPVLFAGKSLELFNSVVAGATGLIIGSGCMMAELTFLSNGTIRWLRRVPLIVLIALRALSYSVIIIIGLILPTLVLKGERMWQEADFALNFLICAVIAAGISTSVEFLRLLGREASVAIFTGRYRRPRLEDRIVLMADLVGSTTLAEKLGELPFHEFLTDVAHDLSQPIEQNGGEVHRYVGDAVFVTWPMARQRSFAQSLACARQMPQALDAAAAAYKARYGQAARIRVALHCGPVAAGEIGTWKKEIALLGDTMNTVARIESAARDLGVGIVISDSVRQHLPQTAPLTPLPAYEARGKEEQLALWTVSD